MPTKPKPKPQNATPQSTAPKGLDLADLIAYRKKGLTLEDIATLTGCTKPSVHYRLKKANLEGLERYRNSKDTVIEAKQQEIINSLTPDDVKKMSGLQKVIATKISEETIRLIRGQAQAIIEHHTIVADLMQARQRMVDAGMLNPVNDG